MAKTSRSTKSNGIAQRQRYNALMRLDSLMLKRLLSSWMIFPVACALAVIGAKCWMIHRFGSPTPFWDQWDAEGAVLYPKFLDGTLHVSNLIAAHNEHRIFVTRLWSLLLLELGGYWDPMLQMAANTLIFGAAVALFIAVVRPLLDRWSWLAFAMLSTAIFLLPFGWENTLAGFQSEWYFLLLFSIAGLAIVVDAKAFTPRWWLATLFLVLSFFSMAGGVLTMAAALAIGAVQFAVGRRSGRREVLALALLTAATVVMVLYTPILAHHAPLKAHSIGQFLHALMDIVIWPAMPGRQPATVNLLRAIFMNAPALLASSHIVRLRPHLTDRRWLVPALTGWAALQVLAVAYARATGPLAPRYLDMYTILLLLNAASVLYFVGLSRTLWMRRPIVLAPAVLWLVLAVIEATTQTIRISVPGMEAFRAAERAGTENVRTYLDTKDIHALENKPRLYIPYPDPQRLAEVLSMPVVRELLPPALVGDASAARAQQRGLARFTGRAVEAIKNFALRWGIGLMPAGLILFALGLWIQWRRSVGNFAPSGIDQTKAG